MLGKERVSSKALKFGEFDRIVKILNLSLPMKVFCFTVFTFITS